MSDASSEVAGTVFQAFESTVQAFGERPFLKIVTDTAQRYGIEPGDISYTQAAAEIAVLGQRYAAAGYARGHRVALLLENRPAFFLNWLALNSLGVSVVPLNPLWRASELQYVLGHSEVCAAIVLPDYQQPVAAAARAAGLKMAVVPASLAGELAPAPELELAQVVDVQTECALLYTSGTTGQPKGCLLGNEYFLWCGLWYRRVGGLCQLEPGNDRLITPLPMYHMNAMAVSTMAMLTTGGCIVPLDRFHPSTWWQSVAEARATIVHYLGVMPAMLLSVEPATADRDNAVRFGFGAGVNASQHDEFESRFGFPLLEAWAMTETGSGAAVIASEEPRKTGTACFGQAPPTLDWRIVGDDGQLLGVGEPGELLVRWAGENPRFGFFDGYLKDADATAAAWVDGFFHTGDVVYRDAEGSFHFVDRKKNVIRRSGENIAAVEVEAVLIAHPDVAAVGVAPVPDAVRGDEVMACIVPQPNPTLAADASARALVDYCLTQLAYFKVPGYVVFCDDLPLTATEKIQRAQLKASALEYLRDGRAVDTRGMKRHHG